MEDKSLEICKQHINENGRNDSIEFLKEYYEGKMFGPLTGYASVDMPWLQHYSDKMINSLIEYKQSNETMYQALYKYASNHIDDVAYEYLGSKITYAKLLKSIDEVAGSLKKMGVNENDIVTILLPNQPEARYLIYACSKIGAISNPIMPTISSDDLESILKNTRSNIAFVMEGMYKKDKTVFNNCKINKNRICEISPLQSASGFLSIVKYLNGVKKENQYQLFIKAGEGLATNVVNKKADDTAIIEQTGGTTGLTSKSVAITNGNIQASNYQLEHGEFDFNKGDVLLDILIPSISYGAAFEHLTACNGIKNIMIPILVKKEINDYISKYKPNHVMMGPIHFEYISNDKHKRNWSSLKNIVSGGDEMTLKLEKDANAAIKKNRANVSVEQGYGESECFGAAACNHNNFIKTGSVGVPHILTNIAVFDVDSDNDDYTTDIEKRINEDGEICISSPVVMKEYLNNKSATDLVIKKHRDGKTWLHTGDIGHIDSGGYLFITDRIKDLIFRDGFKVSPQKVNNLILDNFKNVVDSSIIVGVPNKDERNVPVLFYKLKPDALGQTDRIENELYSFYDSKLSNIERPFESIAVDSFPRTASGKIDKKKIKAEYMESKEKETKELKKLIKRK